MIILDVFVLICLVFIGYQDLRYRAVYWLCFPFLGGLFLFIKSSKAGLSVSMQDAMWALLFFGVQLLFLWIYFSLKKKKKIILTDGYLGWGDILFLIALSFYLSPFNYILFYVLSLVLVLIYILLTNLLTRKQSEQIPLAGLQALMLCVIIVLSILFPMNIIPYDDSWLYKF